MNLLDIKQHLMKVKMASLGSLSAYFNCDAGLLRDMLQHWVRKGCVRACRKTPACGTACQQCDLATIEIYEWV